jgi:hypothetical protein
MEQLFLFWKSLFSKYSTIAFRLSKASYTLATSSQRFVNRTKVDGRTNVICPTRALFGLWTIEKQQCLRK